MEAMKDYFGLIAILTRTFKVVYDLDLKSKIVSLNGKTLEVSSKLNPISHRCHSALFYPLTI